MLDGVKCYVEKILGRTIENMCMGQSAISKEVVRAPKKTSRWPAST